LFGYPHDYNVANGSAYVIFGSSSLGTLERWVTPAPNGTNGVQFNCPSSANTSWGETYGSYELAEHTLDIMDLNGDGINDVVIGVRQGSVTGSNQEGYVYVYFGKSSGWNSPYELSTIY